MTNDTGSAPGDDSNTWPAARIADEVAYVTSEVGRPKFEPREIAFALEIERLNVLLAFARKYGA